MPKTSLRGSRRGQGAIAAVDPSAIGALPHQSVDAAPFAAREASDAPRQPVPSFATAAEKTATVLEAFPLTASTSTSTGDQPKPWRGRRTKRGGVIVQGGKASAGRRVRVRRARRKSAREESGATSAELATKTGGAALDFNTVSKTGELEKLLAEFDEAEKEGGGAADLKKSTGAEAVAASTSFSSLRPSPPSVLAKDLGKVS